MSEATEGGAWKQVASHPVIGIAGTVVSILAPWGITCAAKPQGSKCHAGEVGPSLVALAVWIAFLLAYSYVWAGPRAREAAARSRADSLERDLTATRAELAAMRERRSQRREIRANLADFRRQGDLVWNQVNRTFQIWQADNYSEPMVRVVGPGSREEPDRPPVDLGKWWIPEGEWEARVALYMRETPELGQWYAEDFNSRDLNVEPGRGDRPLATENRLRKALDRIKLQQQWLRGYEDEFADA